MPAAETIEASRVQQWDLGLRVWPVSVFWVLTTNSSDDSTEHDDSACLLHAGRLPVVFV